MRDAVEHARAEFELVSDDRGFGTSKLYSRGDFLPLDDPRAFDEGDFVGRLRTLFGPVDGDCYVLRHRETGIVVTAYSAQSGPSYGGGPAIDPEMAAHEAASYVGRLLQDGQDRTARIESDPDLAAGPPSERPEHRGRGRHVELAELRELDHRWHRRFADASAPDGVPEVIARLDALLSAVPPVDWEVVRYYGDAPSVYRVGAHDGESVVDELGVAESVQVLLDHAERGDRSLVDTAGSPFDDPDLRVVAYWVHSVRLRTEEEEEEDEDDDEEEDEDEEEEDEEEEDEDDEDEEEDDEDDDDEEDDDEEEDEEDVAESLAALRGALPRVQAAWYRALDQLRTYPPQVRDGLAEIARDQIAILELEPSEADAALKAALAG